MDVPLANDKGFLTGVTVVVNQQIDTVGNELMVLQVREVGSKQPLNGTASYAFADNSLTFFLDFGLEPNTTHEAIVTKKARSLDGEKLSGVDDPSVTFKKGKASWAFTTGSS